MRPEKAGDRARTGDIQLGRERALGAWSRQQAPLRSLMRILRRGQHQEPPATDRKTLTKHLTSERTSASSGSAVQREEGERRSGRLGFVAVSRETA